MARVGIPDAARRVDNMIDFGMDVQQAIGAPRIHVEGADPTSPFGPTSRILVADDRIESCVLSDLGGHGHAVAPVFESSVQSCLAKALGVRRRDGELVGGVDVHRRSIGMWL